MKRLHLFLFLSCFILVIVYFGITRPIREPAQVKCGEPCYSAWSTTEVLAAAHWTDYPPVVQKECPHECPICVYNPEGGTPINLVNNKLRPIVYPNPNNEDNSKIGRCIPRDLAPANLLNYVSPNPIAEFPHLQTFNEHPIDMTQLETTVAQIAAQRILAPDGTFLGDLTRAGRTQRLSDINFLGYFLLFMQGLNPPNPPNLTQFIRDTPHVSLRLQGSRTIRGDSPPAVPPSTSQPSTAPPYTIPNLLQLQQANIDRTQQVAVNFPGVVGNTLMLPMIPRVPSSSTGSSRVVHPSILRMFELDPLDPGLPRLGNRNHIDIYNRLIRPAINELLLRLTPEFQAQQRLALAAGGMNPRLGSQSPLYKLPDALIQTIGDNLKEIATPMPNLVQRKGIFRVSFLHDGQSTDLQTVIGQALGYGLSGPPIMSNTGNLVVPPPHSDTGQPNPASLTDQQRMFIILWIFRRFTELSATCGKSPSPPGGPGDGGPGDGPGGGGGGISENVPPRSMRRSLRF